jgi:hypothetical protein
MLNTIVKQVPKNMKDILDVINNIENIYESDTAFQVLKDFERVIDDLDIYVYANWDEGELVAGPDIDRHWITVSFMWPRDKMPDPMGGKRLLDYDCKVKYSKDHILKPRKIETPNDYREGTKKGKLDREPIWIVEIMMPKTLIADIYNGYNEQLDIQTDAATQEPVTPEVQPAELAAEEQGGTV